MLQIILTLAIFLILVIPMGKYMYHIATKQKTFADKMFNPIDNFLYKICGIKREDMGWKKYAMSLVLANAVMVFIGYLILRLQNLLFLNPNGADGMEASLSFNTIISFMTNTNLQHYAGESGLSYGSQLCVIIFMMFTSAASGYAACMAFCRGVSGRKMGNFYEDVIRVTTRILIPFSFVIGLLLVSQGVPQTLQANETIQTIEGKMQDLALGPVAALEAIKHLGTNGGGFFGANSATPFENPTVISNIIETISMMILPGSCVVAFGHMIHDNRKENAARKAVAPKQFGKPMLMGRQAAVIFGAMSILFVVGLVICYSAEMAGNPVTHSLGLAQAGNMEGKEARFGIGSSVTWATWTTAASNGSVNSMHDSYTPLGGMITMLLMQLGEVVFGGVGCGLYGMLGFAILTVFIAGLMVGRTPEYLGKKIEPYEMKWAVLVCLATPIAILVFSGIAAAVPSVAESLNNSGAHGFSEMLYAYSSAGGNNGSAFAGFGADTPFLNLTLGGAMLLARFLPITGILAIAGSMVQKKKLAVTAGTLSTSNGMFVFLLIVIVLLIGALSFFPALALGPIAEFVG